MYATDLSKNSSYAFYFAMDLARKHYVKIIIFHCIERFLLRYSGSIIIRCVQNLQKKKEQEKEQDIVEIKNAAAILPNVESQIGSPCVDLVSEIIVKEGHPAEEILNTADTKGCDVIVLGTHGKGWLKQTFLGSVASSVLERTRKPVFIIPLPSEKSGIEMGAL